MRYLVVLIGGFDLVVIGVVLGLFVYGSGCIVLLALIYVVRIFLGFVDLQWVWGCCDSGLCGDLFGFGLTVDFHCLVRVHVVWFGISVFQLVLMCLDLRWWGFAFGWLLLCLRLLYGV